MVVIIEPKVFGDARGYFFESFSERDFNEVMILFWVMALSSYRIMNRCQAMA